MKRVATLTMNPALDKSCTVESVAPERKLRTSEVVLHPGGGGINVSRAIAQLGGESAAVYTAGGVNGQLLHGLLADAASIEHHVVEIRGDTRENLTVRERSSDQQYRFVMPGAELSRDEWQRCLDQLWKLDPWPDMLVASGSLPPGVPNHFYATLARQGRERDIHVIVDTSGDPLREAVDAGLYMIKPNLRELGQVSGRQLENDPQIEEASKRLLGEGKAQIVVTSLGPGGAVLVWEGGVEHIGSPTVPIRSKVGAGDSMVAGIVLALARGKSVPQAVRFGLAAGAAAVMTPGTELCHREDTERLYNEIVGPASD